MQALAITTKLLGVGMPPGAVYKPAAVMVPNPVRGAETVGIGQPVGPTPCVQFVGWLVLVTGGRQICQKIVVVEEPDATAENWSV